MGSSPTQHKRELLPDQIDAHSRPVSSASVTGVGGLFLRDVFSNSQLFAIMLVLGAAAIAGRLRARARLDVGLIGVVPEAFKLHT